MAVVKMKKMTVYGLKKEKKDVMYLLQRMGAVEITEMDDLDSQDKAMVEDKEGLAEIQRRCSEIEAAINSINDHLGKKGKKGKLPKPECTLKDVNDAGLESDKLDKMLAEINSYAKVVETNNTEIGILTNVVKQSEYLKEMKVPVETVGVTEFTTSFIGKTQADNVSKLNEIASGLDCTFEVLYTDKKDAYFLLLAETENIASVKAQLRAITYAEVDLTMFKKYSGTPSEIISNGKTRIETLSSEKEAAIEKLKSMSKDIPFLMKSYEFYNINSQQMENMRIGAETQYAFVVEGWVREDSVDAIEKSISNVSKSVYVSTRAPFENEQVPTALKNAKIIQPFEAVTDLYSTPAYGGFDPNWIMAPFFWIFFGMMFGDAGYGVIISIGAFIFLKMKKPQGEMLPKLLWIAVFCGIATIIWGSITGGWFAIDNIPYKPLLSPMNDPIPVLLISYALGIVHLFVGYFVGAYLAAKDGDWVGAIFDNLMWVVLFVGLLLWLVGSFIGIPGSIGMYISIGGAVALVATQGRAKKSIFGKVLSGVGSLYDVTGFLSDVLSYSRLFALGLSGSVIGLVVNMLVGMAVSRWYLIPFAIIIAIGGHTFNIALNILGSFVHSARLQYIELYGKFYDGGGVPFKPFKVQPKYIKLT